MKKLAYLDKEEMELANRWIGKIGFPISRRRKKGNTRNMPAIA